MDFNINIEQSHGHSTNAMAIFILSKIRLEKLQLRYTLFLISQKLKKCSNEEKVDKLVVLAHFLTDEVKTVLKENETIKIPEKTKRTVFSSLSTSIFRYKDKLVKIMMKTEVPVAADSILKIFQSIASSWASEQQLLQDT